MGKTLRLPLSRLDRPSNVVPSFVRTQDTLSLPLASHRYAIQPGDYCCSFSDNWSGTHVGTAEIQGDRSEQQDFITTALINEKIRNLTATELRQAHKKTMDEMQQEYGQVKYSGSTGCVATAWINEYVDEEKDGRKKVERILNIVTANLGDSSAYVIILDENNNLVPYKKIRLNTWHKPYDPEETKRIKGLGGEVKYGRLNSYLALSRAFGDIDQLGISHESDVLHHQILLKKGQQAFVVVACDGLDTLSPEKIREIVKKNSRKKPAKIASKLLDNALQASPIESADNISAAVIPVTRTPASAAVFDGHGQSNQVANNIGRHFYSRLNKNIEFTYNSKNNARTLKGLFNNYSGISGKVTLTPQQNTSGNCSVLFKTNKECYPLLKEIQKLAKHHLLRLRDSGFTANDFKIINQGKDSYSLEVKLPQHDLWYAQFSDFLADTTRYIEVMKDYFYYTHHLEKILAQLNDHTIATNLRNLLNEVHKNSPSDYGTASKILKSNYKIFTDFSKQNIKDHLELAQKLHTDDATHCAKWNKAAALMAIIGAALLVVTSILVAVGTCGIGSIPAIFGLTAVTCLLLGSFGLFKRESKIPKLMTESVSLKQGPG